MKNILYGFRTKSLNFIPVTANDVPNIYDLRINRKNNYLNTIEASIDSQYTYIEKYMTRYKDGTEVYLKIVNCQADELFGFVRFTHLKEDYFLGWESLILKSNSPAPVGIQVCFLAYYICFDVLKKSLIGPWFVSANNSHMMKIHNYMNMATIVDVNEKGSTLIVSKKDYVANKDRFLKWGFADEFSIN
jgi:hypothetical protein